ARASAQDAGDRTRRTEPSNLCDRAEERDEREGAEHEERPRAQADRRLGPERDASAACVDEHVPEPQRLPEIEGEEDRAWDERDEARDECDPRGALVSRTAGEAQQRPQCVTASREPPEEEVREDPPLPLGCGGEVLGWRHYWALVWFVSFPLIRPLRNASRPAISPTTAVATPPT